MIRSATGISLVTAKSDCFTCLFLCLIDCAFFLFLVEHHFGNVYAELFPYFESSASDLYINEWKQLKLLPVAVILKIFLQNFFQNERKQLKLSLVVIICQSFLQNFFQKHQCSFPMNNFFGRSSIRSRALPLTSLSLPIELPGQLRLGP